MERERERGRKGGGRKMRRIEGKGRRKEGQIFRGEGGERQRQSI